MIHVVSDVLASWRIGAIVCLGGVFMIAGIAKWKPNASFVYSVQAYTGLMHTRALIIARWLPRIEFLLGLAIMVPLFSSWMAGIMSFLFLAFLFGTIKARKSALTECGCFGELIAEPPSWLTVVRNVLLLCISLTIIVIQDQNSVPDKWIAVTVLPTLLVLSTLYGSEILSSFEI